MKLNFCTECGAGLHKKTSSEYLCANNHTFWNSPHTAAAIILLKDGQALFAKRAFNPKKGQYDFPGGFLKYGESPYSAIKRELMEETGMTTNELQLIYSATNKYEENITVCDLIFVSRSWEGEPIPTDDVASLEWKPIEFMNSKPFVGGYNGLIDTLRSFIQS